MALNFTFIQFIVTELMSYPTKICSTIRRHLTSHDQREATNLLAYFPRIIELISFGDLGGNLGFGMEINVSHIFSTTFYLFIFPFQRAPLGVYVTIYTSCINSLFLIYNKIKTNIFILSYHSWSL